MFSIVASWFFDAGSKGVIDTVAEGTAGAAFACPDISEDTVATCSDVTDVTVVSIISFFFINVVTDVKLFAVSMFSPSAFF